MNKGAGGWQAKITTRSQASVLDVFIEDRSEKTILLKLTYDVIPMGAVRMTGRGKFVKSNAQRYLAYKETIEWQTKAQMKNKELITGPIAVNVLFHMPIPKNLSKKKKDESIGKYHIKRPDTDNLIKGVFDALNNLVWKDDNQVCKIAAKKIYSESPRIEIEINELEG